MGILSVFFGKLWLGLSREFCLECDTELSAGNEDFCEPCLEVLGFRKEFRPLEVQGNLQIHAATLFNRRGKRIVYGYKFNYAKQGRTYETVLVSLLKAYWAGSQAISPETAVIVINIPNRSQSDQDAPRPGVGRIGSAFSARIGGNYVENGLSWSRKTQPQHTITRRKQRQANLADSMVIGKPLLDKIRALIRQGKTIQIVIIDDIITTGATLKAACSAINDGLCCLEPELLSNAGNLISVVGVAVTHVPWVFSGNRIAGMEQPAAEAHEVLP